MKERILLVDDTEFYRKSYTPRLAEEGYHVTEAGNGLEALKALKTERPDLVLLDLVMPVMDGFKVLQAIRADPNLRSMPVIVLSAKGATSEIEKAMSLGATDYLIKANTTPDEVVDTIRRILGGGGLLSTSP